MIKNNKINMRMNRDMYRVLKGYSETTSSSMAWVVNISTNYTSDTDIQKYLSNQQDNREFSVTTSFRVDSITYQRIQEKANKFFNGNKSAYVRACLYNFLKDFYYIFLERDVE